MGERGLMDSVNDVVKAAFELYAADGKETSLWSKRQAAEGMQS